MIKFSISKLSSLSSSLTPKEEAKIVIGYFVKQDSGKGNYENEIKTIINAIPQHQISEYNFYWHMYMNVQQIILDYQAEYLKLQIQAGRLSFLQYFIKLSPLITYAYRFHSLSEPKEEDLCQDLLEMLKVIKIVPSNDIDTVHFLSDELKSVSIDLLNVIQELLQTLVNYKNLFCLIEKKIFDGMEIVPRTGLWQEIDDHIEVTITQHNKVVSEFREHYERLSHPGKVSFEEMPDLLLEKPKEPDIKWVEEMFEKLVSYAERDSYFKWRPEYDTR